MKNRVKWICRGICLCGLLIVILTFLFRATILMRAGQFMAPDGNYTADVAILEGDQFIDNDMVTKGMALLSSGRVKRLILVLQFVPSSDRPFALNEDYPILAGKKLKALGLKERDFRIVVVHYQRPVTLAVGRGVAEAISKEDIKSAVLISSGFHTRRSYLVYQHLCNPSKVRIFPSAWFKSYQLEHWWSQDGGLRDFVVEVLKLTYYLVRGYIPFKLSY
jgi:hypothetical protein